MTDLPASACPPASLPLSSVTLNAMHFKYINNSESLKILHFLKCLEAAQASCPVVVGEPSVTAGLAGQWPPSKSIAPLCWSKVSRAGSVMETRVSHSQCVQTGPLGWGQTWKSSQSQEQQGLGHRCSVALEGPKTDGLRINANPE